MKILDLKQAAKYLGVSRRTMYRLLKSGQWPAFKIAGNWRVRRADLDCFIRHKLTYYGLTAVRPFIYSVEVLERYRANPQKYYLFDEAFKGRLGSRQDYYDQMCRRSLSPDKPFLPELSYHKIRLADGKEVVVLSAKEFARLRRAPLEEAHWIKYLDKS